MITSKLWFHAFVAVNFIVSGTALEAAQASVANESSPSMSPSNGSWVRMVGSVGSAEECRRLCTALPDWPIDSEVVAFLCLSSFFLKSFML